MLLFVWKLICAIKFNFKRWKQKLNQWTIRIQYLRLSVNHTFVMFTLIIIAKVETPCARNQWVERGGITRGAHFSNCRHIIVYGLGFSESPCWPERSLADATGAISTHLNVTLTNSFILLFWLVIHIKFFQTYFWLSCSFVIF